MARPEWTRQRSATARTGSLRGDSIDFPPSGRLEETVFTENIDELVRWGWIVLAVLFFLFEIFTAGFVLLCFGIGALGAALVAFMGAGMAWQIVVFIVVTIAAVVLARPFADRISRPGVQPIAGNRMIGKWGVVLQTVDPLEGTGMVRVESERWRAESMESVPLEVGEVVKVVGVDGVRLQVQSADEESGDSDEQVESAA
ncbi:MAG: NfeD family protein [Caldilineaceae bacterium SB0661_bin_32]|uniref:NfeD family protein n=1 Tax=Caldilineaceae bacterium SB0661_bin_32 TaxID=2605255 RepID=A0A6B1DAK7_9CHLR|nr:NfeD family protein [Caldilineaceae bacterium SB0661_bin_32]